MRSELRVAPHSIHRGELVIEIWYDDRLVGQVTAADHAGVRVLSKYPIRSDTMMAARATPVYVIEISIGE